MAREQKDTVAQLGAAISLDHIGEKVVALLR